jgi:hypothetical protein
LKIGDSLFLPTAGSRLGANGALFHHGESGYYWSNSAAPNADGYYLDFWNANQGMSYGQTRSLGSAVRCVAN